MESPQFSNILVEVLGKKFSLDETTIASFPEEVFQWELGGITDPIGQVSGWLWSQIQTALNLLEATVRAVVGNVRTGLETFFNQAIAGVTSSLSSVYSIAQGLSGSLSSLGASISGTFSTITSALGSISSNVASFYSWLQQIYGSIQQFSAQISSTLSSSLGNLQGWISTAIGSISATMSSLAGAIANISSTVSTLFGQFSQTISGIIGNITKVIQDAFKNVSTVVGQVTTQLSSIGQALSGVLTQISTTLGGIGGQLWNAVTGLKDWLVTSFKDFYVYLQNAANGIWTLVTNFPKAIGDLWAWIQGGFGQVQTWFTSNIYTPLKDWFTNNIYVPLKDWFTKNIKIPSFDDFKKWITDGFNGAVGGLFKDLWNFLPKQVQDFVTSATTIFNALTERHSPSAIDNLVTVLDIVAHPGKMLTDPVINKQVVDFFSKFNLFGSIWKSVGDAYDWLKDNIVPTIMTDLGEAYTFVIDGAKGIWDGFTGAASELWKMATTGITGMVDKIAKEGDAIVKWATTSMASWLFTPFSSIPSKIYADYQSWAKKGVGLTTVSPDQLLLNLGGYMMGAITTPYLASAFMRFLGSNMKGRVSLQPFGIGANITVDFGSIMLHLSKLVWKLPDTMLASLGYGLGIWIWQPTARLINATSRNALPIMMPNLQEIRSMANRASQSTTYSRITEILGTFMAYYGYSDWTIGWNLGEEMAKPLGTKASEFGELETSIQDRFGKTIRIPLALRYQMPSGSDLARMMLHDLIPAFDQFQKAMSVEGFAPDISKLYYLLHYRYPQPEMLWNFYRRGMAGMLWYKSGGTTYPEKAAGIGFDPKDPASMNFNQSLFTSIMENYMKWHDYAPFAWLSGFPADRSVVLDLLADIPQRIDARWLYKWSIIPDGTLDGKTVHSVFNIVRARGTHPDWEEEIAVSECMNALSEERSSARSGILNTFERGFLAYDVADKALDVMTTVKMVGKDREVKNLEGERKLLLLRHTWDKALNTMRGAWGFITRGFTRNMIPDTDALNALSQMAKTIGNTLNLPLSMDAKYLTAWMSTLTVSRDFETVQRVRRWMNVLIYRASQLAEGGIDYTKLIMDYSVAARLTPMETEIMLTLGQAFIDGYKKTSALGTIKSSVKGRLTKGAITLEQAVAELVKAGMEKDQATAFLSSESQVREVSTDKLIGMREYIPIDLSVLDKKMDAEGVPPDEQDLYLPYAVARELSSEISKGATEVVADYVAGQYTDAQLKIELDKLATLDGTVKAKYKVDWICLSPEERDLMISLAKKKKARMTGTGGTGAALKTFTTDKLVTLMEDVPIAGAKFKATMDAQGVPLEEQKLYSAYSFAGEVKEEIGRIVSELITDYANGLLTDAAFKKQLDDLATMGGAVPNILGVDWIVLSPTERQLYFALAQLRKARAKKIPIG